MGWIEWADYAYLWLALLDLSWVSLAGSLPATYPGSSGPAGWSKDDVGSGRGISFIFNELPASSLLLIEIL